MSEPQGDVKRVKFGTYLDSGRRGNRKQTMRNLLENETVSGESALCDFPNKIKSD